MSEWGSKRRRRYKVKKFMEKYPSLEDSLDTILGILSGSFALIAIIIVWIKEFLAKNKDK